LASTTSGSGTFLGLASDGNKYWVKAPNNPQGPRTLAAEVIVHGIGNLFGAPVCRTALIEIPDSMNYRFTPQHWLHGGIGHGSLDIPSVVVSEEWPTYASRDSNRERQALLLGLWDLCMGGDQQWLHDTTDSYSIWSYDHGFWLGGEGDWSGESLQKIGTTPWLYDRQPGDLDPGIASARALYAAASAVLSLDRDAIHAVANSVPIEWKIPSPDLATVADLLFLRTEGVAQRLTQAAIQTSFN
jgi:hypothetical protein